MTQSTIDIGSLSGDRRRLRKEKRVHLTLQLAAVASLVVSGLIVVSLVGEAWTFISQVGWSTVWGDQWAPRFGEYDIKTLLVGSLMVTGIAMLVAVPVGLGSAVYLSEYANERSRKVIKPVLEVLAGIPSVVLGFFALTWISPNVVQRLNDEASIFNLMAAGLGVGILTIPLMASISEDAMRSVPMALREAAAGLGSRRMTTSVKVIIPAAVSGLVAAAIVTVSRAIGETMVVFIAAGGAGNQTQFTTNPFDSGSTMTAAIAAQASGTDSVVGEGLTFQSLFFVALVLFVITMVLNLLADRFVRAVRQAY